MDAISQHKFSRLRKRQNGHQELLFLTILSVECHLCSLA